MRNLSQRALSAARWRLGLPVIAPPLEGGSDDAITRFYSGRLTDCSYVTDPEHYEHPRAQWILGVVRSGNLLEIGCGNGGMTAALAKRASQVTALDVSHPSLEAISGLDLPNVTVVEALVEQYSPSALYDWIVMSEVIEHLRRPAMIVRACVNWLAPGGSLLVTTPNGHWESNEHINEFTFSSFSKVVSVGEADQVTVQYLRDGSNRRRWLAAQVSRASTSPAHDVFSDRAAVRRMRRQP